MPYHTDPLRFPDGLAGLFADRHARENAALQASAARGVRTGEYYQGLILEHQQRESERISYILSRPSEVPPLRLPFPFPKLLDL